MRSGDVVRVRLPHDESGGKPCILIEQLDVTVEPMGVGNDVWWEVIYGGELKEIHQDYFREVISEVA